MWQQAQLQQAALVVAVMGKVAPLLQPLEQQTGAVAVVALLAVGRVGRVRRAALVSLSCPFQLPNTQAQPQAHQLSRQAVQTQF